MAYADKRGTSGRGSGQPGKSDPVVTILLAIVIILAGNTIQALFSQPGQSGQTPQVQTRTQSQDGQVSAQDDQSVAISMADPSELVDCYVYQHMDVHKQLLYRQLYAGMRDRLDTINFVFQDEDDIQVVYEAVLLDHPELFYVKTDEELTFKETGSRASLDSWMSMSDQEVRDRQVRVDTFVRDCLADLPAQATDYDKAKHVYEYLISHTTYDPAAPDNQNILSVCLQGSSVCAGYAKTFQYLMQRLDIPCTLVTGTAHGEYHAWDLVLLDGDYYYVDPTWGDMTFAAEAGVEPPADLVDYTYLNVTSEQMDRQHAVGEDYPVDLPDCTQTKDNYFVREGRLVSDGNADASARAVRDLLAKDKAAGKSNGQYQAASIELMDQVNSRLLNEKNGILYDALGKESIRYVRDPDSGVTTVLF